MLFTGIKAYIESRDHVPEGATAYATDTNEFGTYNGATWTWGQGGAGDPMEDQIDVATIDDTPANGDEWGYRDIISGILKKMTWLNILTRVSEATDALYAAIAHTHEVDQRADVFLDSEGNPAKIGTEADGTSTYAARRDHVHEITSGSAVLGSTFSITGTAGTYQDTGLSVTLPSAGTYLIDADIRGAVNGNAGTLWWIQAKLFNSTDSADVTDSETIIVLLGTSGTRFEITSSLSMLITVAASKTIKLYAARNGNTSPSWTLSQILSDANGRTRLRYTKIG